MLITGLLCIPIAGVGSTLLDEEEEEDGVTTNSTKDTQQTTSQIPSNFVVKQISSKKTLW